MISDEAWDAGKRRAEADAAQLTQEAQSAGAPVPDDSLWIAAIPFVDPETEEVHVQGCIWLVEREPECRADLVTWLLPDPRIGLEALAKFEAHTARLTMTKALFDEIHVQRTGQVVDLSASVAKLRAHRASLSGG